MTILNGETALLPIVDKSSDNRPPIPLATRVRVQYLDLQDLDLQDLDLQDLDLQDMIPTRCTHFIF